MCDRDFSDGIDDYSDSLSGNEYNDYRDSNSGNEYNEDRDSLSDNENNDEFYTIYDYKYNHDDSVDPYMRYNDFVPFYGNKIGKYKNSEAKVHTLTALCLRALSEKMAVCWRCLTHKAFPDIKSYKIYSVIKQSYFAKLTRSILDMARHKCHGYVYGGYLRDLIAGEISNNIEIHFEDGDYRDIFLDDFLKNFDVTDLYELNKRGSQNYLIKHKILKDFILVLKLSISHEYIDDYYYELGVNYHIQEERDYDPPARNFDVNTLDWGYIGIYTLSSDKCVYKDVIKNCQNKKFIVLDRHLNPTISHDHDKICGCSRAECNLKNLCIERDSEEGQQIIDDMINMEERGWTCLNEVCNNPLCILFSEKTIKPYEQHQMNDRQQKDDKQQEDEKQQEDNKQQEDDHQENDDKQWYEKKMLRGINRMRSINRKRSKRMKSIERKNIRGNNSRVRRYKKRMSNTKD